MGPWCVLLLSLTLPTVLQGQDPTTPPQVANFQSNQFQGQWFVLGLASNTYRREDRALLNTFSTTFGLNQKGHFEVSNTMTRGKRCNTWSYVLIPAAQPGHFTVDTKGEADPGGRAGTGKFSEDVQVVDGDYTIFALLLSVRRMGSQTTIRISLLAQADTGICPAGRWTDSPAWSKLRVSPRTTSSSQLPSMSCPILPAEAAEGPASPALPSPTVSTNKGTVPRTPEWLLGPWVERLGGRAHLPALGSCLLVVQRGRPAQGSVEGRPPAPGSAGTQDSCPEARPRWSSLIVLGSEIGHQDTKDPTETETETGCGMLMRTSRGPGSHATSSASPESIPLSLWGPVQW
ncbi:epididymal-specific lipocalin-12 isoform 2-T2 [Callospermophilus lateralis]|uniref:epididymal-specific lipocalin-12 isoform X1 n=1 Tax=Callospermophilus lateralis TaxID=76772 RepID=UPI0040386359